MPIAILFMFVALALITPTLMHGIQQSNQLIMGTVAAKQLHQVTVAAKGYITAYAGAIEGQATATTPATITVPMLVNTGFLPQGFQAGNPYGQTWEVQVLQPQPGNLQALVLSQGGTPIQPADAPRIASEAGAEGGTINTANNTAQGSYGGWSVSMNGYANPGAGHLAALVAYSNGQLQSDYLYRVAVPGQPQLNTMQTNLNMGNNDIDNAQNVNVNQHVTLGNPGPTTGGYAASEPGQLGVNEPAGQGFPQGWGGGIHTWDEYANGTISTGENDYQATNMNGFNNVGSITAQNANNGNYAVINTGNTGSNPEIYTNGVIDAGSFGGNSFATYNGAWWANNSGSSSQSGNLYAGGQVTAGYDAVLGTANGSANIGWGCSPNGEIAANANGSGQVLACQGGSWQAMGGGGGPVQVAQFAAGTGPIPGYWQLCAAETEVNEIGGIWVSGGPYNINGSNFYTWYQNSDRPNGQGVGQYVCENWAFP